MLIVNVLFGSCVIWVLVRFIPSQERQSPTRLIRFIPICYVISKSLTRTKLGQLISRTFQWLKDSCTWLPLWTGIAAKCCLAPIEHHGYEFLYRSSRRGASTLRPARHLQLRSGQPVYQHRVHTEVTRPWCTDQHGWERPLGRQRFHRAVVAKSEI